MAKIKAPEDASKDGEFITWVQDVTPALAKIWLTENNSHNRRLNPERVNLYSTDMKNGDWRLIHTGIAFSSDFVILDGQHRLAAVVQSGVTVKMQITVGMKAEDQIVIDTGQGRSAAQALGLEGQDHPKAFSAATNMVSWLIANHYFVLSNAQYKKVFEEWKDAFAWLGTVVSDKVMQKSAVGGAFILAYATNPEKVAEFAAKFLDGSGLDRKDPVFAARKLFFERPKSKVEKRRDVSLRILRCIRATLEGTEISPNNVQAVESTVDYFCKVHLNKDEEVLGRMIMDRRARRATVIAQEKWAKQQAEKKGRAKKGEPEPEETE